MTDHLGNVVGDLLANGAYTNSLDYKPFGQVFSGNTNDPFMFTGKERDAESGLDYFGARYYSSNMGRFSSPDPSGLMFADASDPQSFNLYSYARNNPLSFVDPSGMAYCQWDDGSHDDSANTGVDGAVNSRGDCEGQGGTWSYADGLGDDGTQLPTGPPDLTLTALYHPPGTADTQSSSIGGILDCAAKFGSDHSIASLTGLGKLGGATGFVANTLGGNTFSGLTTLSRTLTSSTATGGQVATQMGKAYLRGPLQGIPARPLVAAGLIAEDSAAKISPSGMARGALVKAAFNAGTGADESLITLSGEVGLSTVGSIAAEFATGVGEAKAIFDLGTFLWGIGTCSVP